MRDSILCGKSYKAKTFKHSSGDNIIVQNKIKIGNTLFSTNLKYTFGSINSNGKRSR